ncbi:hypothetical protein GCM10017786_37430 [Amycolatopsis deserti]|uniref:Uncharacterized protein n=1 Tax=Amycolatopsis deserti TaxID=185696 RepID=A0ABQ3J5B2_9PSEU|nr:hypothetical protein GCM10017786_37430 [Amycolatopsis deserti]
MVLGGRLCVWGVWLRVDRWFRAAGRAALGVAGVRAAGCVAAGDWWCRVVRVCFLGARLRAGRWFQAVGARRA